MIEQAPKSLFDVDENALDKEWVLLPKTYYEWALKLADARLTYAEKKAMVEVVEADVDKLIRTDPSKYGVEKVTESLMAKLVATHSQTENAVRELNQAKHQMDILQAAMDAFECKKKALESLVFLQGMNYHSAPKAKGPQASEAIKNSQRASAAKKIKIDRT